jgi:hypothetical protein
MTRDDIIRMAREATGEPAWDGGVDWVWGEVERFAKLVAEHEREACAALCDKLSDEDGFEGSYADRCAFAIRERGAP